MEKEPEQQQLWQGTPIIISIHHASSLGDLGCLSGDLRSKVSQDQWRSSSVAWPGSFGGRWPCFCFPAGVNNTGAMEQEWILLEPKVFQILL